MIWSMRALSFTANRTVVAAWYQPGIGAVLIGSTDKSPGAADEQWIWRFHIEIWKTNGRSEFPNPAHRYSNIESRRATLHLDCRPIVTIHDP